MGGLAVLGDHRRDDRPFNDQAQFLGDHVGIHSAAFHDQRPEPVNYLVAVRTSHIPYPGTVLFMLRHCVDEYATEEVFFREPFLQKIEQGEDALPDRAVQTWQITIESVKPHVRFRIEHYLEQIFLGAVVRIEATAGHTCFLKNP